MQAKNLLDEVIDQTTLGRIGGGRARPPICENWKDCLIELQRQFVAHARAEEIVFYEALREIGHHSEMADTKTEEHHVIEELIESLLKLTPVDRGWGIRLSLLKNQLESHVAEEETVIFGAVMLQIDDELADEMGRRFEILKASYLPPQKRRQLRSLELRN